MIGSVSEVPASLRAGWSLHPSPLFALYAPRIVDDATARRMHSLLAHKPGEYPASCPICEAQVKLDAALQQVEPMERDDG